MDNTGDEPPRLTRGNGAKQEKAGDAGAAQGGTGSGKTAPTAEKPAEPAAKEPAPAAQKSGDQTNRDQMKGNQPDQSQAHPEAAENYYRPTLRRGKPTETAPEEKDTPRQVEKGGAAATVADSAASTTTVQLVPAISDAGGPEPQSYRFYWKDGEEDERRKQMLALAADEVRAYVTARAKGEIPAKPAAKAGTANRKSAAKPAEPILENVLFRGFDVWKNNQPVMILSAEAHFEVKVAKAATDVGPETYSITLVTRTDIYGNLRKLYAGVTDKFHLDVTPRLELVDVVDADGDGRGELLFRETSDAGKGYVIYRATGDKLWKMFDSLGGE
jgi:hypothetical protein